MLLGTLFLHVIRGACLLKGLSNGKGTKRSKSSDVHGQGAIQAGEETIRTGKDMIKAGKDF